MSFVNCRRKFNPSFLTFSIVLTAIVSIAFGAVGASAQSIGGEKIRQENFFSADSQSERAFGNMEEAKRFSFFSNNSETFSGDSLAARTDASALPSKSQKIAGSPVFAEFDAWVNAYVSRGFTADEEQTKLGESLALRRRQLLKKLIQLDPQAALGKAVSPEILDRLPSFITENSETRIGAYGNFLVYAFDGGNHSDGRTDDAYMERQIVVGETRYKAFVYGRREAMTTKFDIPLRGVAIDDLLAVDENFARQLKSNDYESRVVDSSKFSKDGIAAELGGETAYFSDQSEFENFVAEEIRWESKIEPARLPVNSGNQALATEQLDPTWTEGVKKVLFIRVDFPERTGDPVDFDNRPLTLDRAQALFNNEIKPFYDSNSYGKTSLQTSFTPVIHLLKSQAYYAQGSNYLEMQTEARAAARAIGSQYDTDGYDLDIIGFGFSPSFGWAGLSSIGAKGSLLNGAFYLPEAAHEIGHNYGLLHANLWRTTDGTKIGAGSNIEYGDCYDMMSATLYCNLNSNSHFNARFKRLLNWLTVGDVQTVVGDGNYSVGTYTINAQDSMTSGLRALKIPKNETKNYWVEFRQLQTNNQNAMNGALIRWDYASQDYRETQLLDMNPATQTVNDAPLAIGQSFTDEENGIRITVVGRGDASPQSLKIQVELGLEIQCNYSLSETSAEITSPQSGAGSTNIRTGSGCAWTATTSDSWITITGGNSGRGDGTISFAVAKNVGAARTGTIIIKGQPFYVTQVAGDCNYSVNPSPLPTVSASGGTLNYGLNGAPGCNALTPTTTDSWITVNNNSITVAPNTSGAARRGEVRLVGEDALNNSPVNIVLTINQSADQTTNCNFSLSATSAGYAAGTVNGSVSVASGSGCAWTAVSNASWITITGGSSGSATGTVSFSVESNVGAARTGTIVIAGQTFTVSQLAGKSRKRVRFV